MARNTGNINIVREYIDKFPEIVSDRTLARKIFEETDVFTSVENARSSVRMARGHIGNKDRSRVSKKEYFTPLKNDTHPTKYMAKEKAHANILILDIETAPIKAYVWSLWKQTVNINQIVNDWFCLTWSAKWLFDKKVISDKLTGQEAIKQDDKRIIKNLWSLLDQADIVIAHNGDQFDIPKINTRFIIHGLNPPSPYQTIDTLKTLRKNFGFASNKLDHVNRMLQLRQKIDTGGFELWDKCYKGDDKALALMEKYNINDVRILEETYLRLRPWIKPHPNIALYILDELSRCPSCGSEKLKSDGIYYSFANKFEGYRCCNCGSQSRKRVSDINVKERRHLVMSIPK
jgi:DNA polymerase elongation subunit (family B)